MGVGKVCQVFHDRHTCMKNQHRVKNATMLQMAFRCETVPNLTMIMPMIVPSIGSTVISRACDEQQSHLPAMRVG